MDDPFATKPATAGETTSAGTRFRILRPHARGGLGEVFVALDEELHREVALKEIQEQHADEHDSRARFVLEAEITGGLEHPGVVPVYGLGAHPDGRPFYAMRFIRGDSLEEAIERLHASDGRKPDPSAYNLELRRLLARFIDVCNAITYAHSRGVLHCDLKPGNIMLGKYGETLVVDWGLAKIIGRKDEDSPSAERPLCPASVASARTTQTGEAVGTPQFMSPEQVEGRRDELTPAADVYCLGATLYALLTGRAAFRDNDLWTVLRQVVSGNFPPPRAVNPAVPSVLEAVCLKAMALRPADRYASPRALADDIEHWLADEPVSVWREPWHWRLWRWSRRHRTLLTGVAAVVSVSIVGLAVFAAVLGRKNRELEAANRAAQENFAQAHQAVRDLLEQAQGNALLHKPGMHAVQETLLRSALAYYRDFLTRRSDDPQLRDELAEAHIAVAGIVQEIGSPDEARAEYDAARQVLSVLTAAAPDVPRQRRLALVYSRLAQLDAETGRVEANRNHFQRALVLYNTLRQERPGDEATELEFAHACLLQGEDTNDPVLLSQARDAVESTARGGAFSAIAAALLARIDNQIGLIETNAGRLDDAAAALLRAGNRLQMVPAGAIDEADLESLRGALDLNRGRLAAKQGKAAEADAAFQSAANRFESLNQRDPDVCDYPLRAATAHLELGKRHLVGERTADAERELALARRWLASLAWQHARVLDRFELARSCLDLATVMLRTGQIFEARELLAQSRRTLESLVEADPQRADYHRNLAGIWNQLASIEQREGNLAACVGALDRARQELEQISATQPNRPEFRNSLAKVYVNLATVQAAQDQWPDAERWFRQAGEIYDDEVRHYPDIVEYQRDRDEFLHRFGALGAGRLAQLGDSAAAEAERRELRPRVVEALRDLERRGHLPEPLAAVLRELEQQLPAAGPTDR